MTTENTCSRCLKRFTAGSLSLQTVCPTCSTFVTSATSPSAEKGIRNQPEPSTQIQARADLVWRAVTGKFRVSNEAARNEPLNWLAQGLTTLAVLSTAGFVLFLFMPFRPQIVLFGTLSCFALMFGAGFLLTAHKHPVAYELGRAILAICGMVAIPGSLSLALFILLAAVCGKI